MKWRWWYVPVLIFFTPACAQDPWGNHFEGFEDYVSQFVADSQSQAVNQPVWDLSIQKTKWPDQQLGEIGDCTRFPNYRKIRIDPEYWDAADNYERTALLYHEMGHCVLGYDHRDNSIMQPYLIELTSSNYQSYVHEFFHPGEYK